MAGLDCMDIGGGIGPAGSALHCFVLPCVWIGAGGASVFDIG